MSSGCVADQKAMAEKGLLESIQQVVGCMYMSDLHLAGNRSMVRYAVTTVAPDRYSVREWNDAVAYITGQSLSFENTTDAAKYLMNCLD